MSSAPIAGYALRSGVYTVELAQAESCKQANKIANLEIVFFICRTPENFANSSAGKVSIHSQDQR